MRILDIARPRLWIAQSGSAHSPERTRDLIPAILKQGPQVTKDIFRAGLVRYLRGRYQFRGADRTSHDFLAYSGPLGDCLRG